MEYVPFPKIARYRKPVVVTEKIDGTNAQIHILDDGTVLAGARTRYITPENDNFGFAAWVEANKAELTKLGPGRHYGEWWGQGIQRGYGLTEKRFSLFNSGRWTQDNPPPSCCFIVPVLAVGEDVSVADCMAQLRVTGSLAAPGFMAPEGVVVYHTASRTHFKETFDPGPKGEK